MTPPSRLFNWLVRLYPRTYRARYEAEMEAFHQQERAAGEGGVGYALRLVVDHVEAAAAVRREGGDGMMRSLLEDLTGGWRALRRAPAFTGFAVLTLSLGIGATTAVFSVLDRVVLRPLPYPDSNRMALVGSRLRHDPDTRGPLSPAILVALQATTGPAEAVVGAAGGRGVLRDMGDPERMEFTRVSPGFFEFFGARAAVGRLLGEADHAVGAERAAVLGHGFWRERFGGDAGAVGRTLRLDDETYTVVGVLGSDFVPPPEVVEAGDIYVSLRLAEGEPVLGSFSIAGVARLRPGAALDDLETHIGRQIEGLYAQAAYAASLLGGVARPFHREVVGDVGGTLGRVLGAVLLLLLIACANVASLLLTRGAERSHELAVRTALGAGRGRLARQLLSQSLLLALMGGAVGSAIAFGAVEAFRRYAPDGLPRLAEVAVDARGLGFSLLLGLVTVLLFGVVPALRSARRSSSASAALTSRGATTGRREGRLRGALVTMETALAVMLAVGSALLAHDLVRMATLDPGFRPDGVVALRLGLAPRYGEEEWVGIWDRLLEGAEALPGVTAAAVATQVPYTGDRTASLYRPEGVDMEEGEFVITISVAGDYLAALGARMAEGRPLVALDARGAPAVMVNEAFVTRYWPGESALGRYVRSDGERPGDAPSHPVVGVIADMVTDPGDDVAPRVYVPLASEPGPDMEVIVRTDGNAVALAPALRSLVQRIDPTLPVTSVRTVRALGRQVLARPRFYTTLFGGFAAVALLLAVVGVYGTTAYAARARTREIGIRMALGAVRARVVRGELARTGLVVVLGVLIGLAAAWVASRALVDVLHHVTPRDRLSYGAVAALVLASGLLAAWWPAERAGRVDPVDTLKGEG